MQPGQRRHERRGTGGNHDAARRDHVHLAVRARDLHVPGVEDACVAGLHVHTQRGVTRHRIVGCDLPHGGCHAVHHLREVELEVGARNAEVGAVSHVAQQRGGADQRLAGHAAGVQAVAAHLVRFHQRHPRLHGGCDVAGDQARRPGADDHHVAVEALGLAPGPARVHAACLPGSQGLLRQQREQAQQHERPQQAGADDATQRLDARQLRAGVHVHRRAGQHAQLAGHPVRARGNVGQPHQQVHQEVREQRHQPQAEQVEGAVARHAGVDVGQALAEARGHRAAQQVARAQHRQQRAQRGREGHQHQPAPQAEQGACRQRQCRSCTGNRHRRDQHVHAEERSQHAQWMLFVLRGHVGLRGLQVAQADEAAQVEGKEEPQGQQQGRQQQQLLAGHRSTRAAAFNAWRRRLRAGRAARPRRCAAPGPRRPPAWLMGGLGHL